MPISIATACKSAYPTTMRSPLVWNRRRFLACTALFTAGPGFLRAAPPLTPAAAFDPCLERFMEARHIPGGALAVVKDGRLVYARGYGWADRARREPVLPGSLFRIASLSKPVTAAAILKLAEQKKLKLEDRVFDTLDLGKRVSGEDRLDPRWRAVTLAHLLHHTGGWDRDKTRDPMFLEEDTLARTSPDLPPRSPWGPIRYQLAQPLDFEPGSRYAYSNFGYCLLGRVIEAVTGQTYEAAVRRLVLDPAGIRRMRLGRGRDRVEAEVGYHDPAADGAPDRVNLEIMDSHGGWLASVVDLARFAAAFDRPASPPVLQPASLAIMHAPPPAPVWRRKDGSLEDVYYGCGWLVRPVGNSGRANYWHTGSLPGTWSLLVRRWDGLSWTVVFNQRSKDSRTPDGAIDPALHEAADQVTEWPSANLFADHA